MSKSKYASEDVFDLGFFDKDANHLFSVSSASNVSISKREYAGRIINVTDALIDVEVLNTILSENKDMKDMHMIGNSGWRQVDTYKDCYVELIAEEVELLEYVLNTVSGKCASVNMVFSIGKMKINLLSGEDE